MSTIDARSALTQGFVAVKDDRSQEILRIVGPHDLYVGIAGFKTSSISVTGNGTIVGDLTVSGTIYDGSGNAYSTGGGGGGGAPTTARYVTLATDSNLTQERVLTQGTGITITDGGAGAAVTIALSAPVSVANGGTGASGASTARSNLGLGTIATQASDSVSITGGSIAGITDLAVADGGTGASDAANARSNLGLGTISTQASNSVTITGGSITGITDLAIADGGTGASDASTARTNLGLGTLSTQASNSVTITGGSITGITDLAVADGGTGASTASGARTNLGLGNISTQNSGSVSIVGGDIVINDLYASASIEAYNIKSVVSASNGIRVRRSINFYPLMGNLSHDTFPIGGSGFFRVDGTATQDYDESGAYVTYTFTGTGNVAGFSTNTVGSSLPLTRTQSLPTYSGYIKTYSSITNCTIAIGFLDNNAGSLVNSNTPAKSYAAFQFSTSRGDTTWIAIASGSGATTQRTANTGVTVAASTNYYFEMSLDANGHFTGSISGNGSTSSVTLAPGIDSSTDLGIVAYEKASSAVTRGLSIYGLHLKF